MRKSLELRFSLAVVLFSAVSFAVVAIGVEQARADGMDAGSSAHHGHSHAHSKSDAHASSGHSKSASSRKVKSKKDGNTNPLDDFELAKYQYCGSDSDCTVAINGCCDCANGGVEVAVNKTRLEAFRNRFDCLHVKCGMKAADPVCESGVVSCISHRCNYFDEANRNVEVPKPKEPPTEDDKS